MKYKRVTEREIYWRDQWKSFKKGLFSFLVHILVVFVLGAVFGLAAGKGFLFALGAE